MGRLHFFDQSLLESQTIGQIDNFKRITARPNGWHYDLDMAWILSNLKKANVQPGATILDAGAGLGIFQFLLAGLGYHVISLDFAARIMPASFVNLFNISGDGMTFDASEYDHQYMRVINYGDASPRSSTKPVFRGLLDLMDRYDSFDDRLSIVRRALLARLKRMYSSLIRLKKIRLNRNRIEGSIRLIRAPFHSCNIEPSIVDAVVSISAIEHSDIQLIPEALAMFRRVTKPGGKILLTTSMSRDCNRAFDYEVQGYNFATADFHKIFEIRGDNSPSRSQLDAYESSLLSMEKLWFRLDDYYKLNPKSHFYRGEIQRLPYLPVGLEL